MDHQMAKVLDRLAVSVGTPRALSVSILARHGEWAQLQELRCHPASYHSAEEYFKDCLVTDLLRKCDLPSGIDKEAAAVATFYACERKNCETNARLNHWLPESELTLVKSDRRVLDFIQSWRKEIRRVLGKLPEQLTPRFSAGATFLDRGEKTTIPHKITSQPTSYPHSQCLHPFVYSTLWGKAILARRKSQPKFVRGNRFATVPKDATKHRGICVEASLNVALQLDVGRSIRRRLRSIGIDLKHGQALHRAMAELSSYFGYYATVDLSNASDTICYNLVKLLLPDDWFALLCSLRATHTKVRGRWVRLEKFSSMGNGFTFELETLLFATLARVLVAREGGDADTVLCYGDDLIVPEKHAKSLLAALALFGFEPNEKKTFCEGPFRESCGGDFFLGEPVRAHFLKELPMEPQHWIALANGLRRADPQGRYVSRAWHECLSAIPEKLRRLRGPEHLGDLVIHDHESRWVTRTDHNGTRSVQGYRPVSRALPLRYFPPEVQLASCMVGIPSTGPTPRDSVAGYKVSWMPCDLTNHWLPTA